MLTTVVVVDRDVVDRDVVDRDAEVLKEAAVLLESEWPARPAETRFRSMSGTHILLLDPTVVAYAKIAKAREMMTSVVVAKSYRGQGLGRRLVSAAEVQAKKEGFAFLYLAATENARGFYERCGYEECGSSETRMIDTSALERLLVGRGAEEGTWMRKRLRDRSLETFILDELPGDFHIKKCRWERQVGPTCGLVALRCARDALTGGNESDDLLAMAQAKGMTRDGEIFDIVDLAKLAVDFGLGAHVVQSTRWFDVVPRWLDSGGLVVVAYDQDSRDHLPVEMDGHNAHYALIVGYNGATKSIVAVHGLSKRPLITDLDTLYRSNLQLRAVKPRRATAWVVPETGIRLGEGRLLLLSRSKS